MKKLLLSTFAVTLLAAPFAHSADIKTIEDYGAPVVLDDILPYNKPAVLFFYTPWDQDSVNLKDEVETWSQQYFDLTVIFIDCANEDSEVYKQFGLKEIPSIVVYDSGQAQVGSIITSLSELEDLVRDNNVLN
jgi:thiol-disulfide isomerase/thioredoxin